MADRAKWPMRPLGLPNGVFGHHAHQKISPHIRLHLFSLLHRLCHGSGAERAGAVFWGALQVQWAQRAFVEPTHAGTGANTPRRTRTRMRVRRPNVRVLKGAGVYGCG